MLFAVSCSVFGVPAPVKGVPESDWATAIRAYAETEITKERHVGAALSVWYRGKVIFTENWGVADLDAGTPVTDDTLFFAASLLKTITGHLALTLADEGKLDLDAPVHNYVPDFPAYSDGSSPTVWQLLVHMGGIRHYFRLPDDVWQENWDSAFFDAHYETATDALAHMLNVNNSVNAIAKIFPETPREEIRRNLEASSPYRARPGERVGYSSFGFTLIAAVLETIEGRPFSQTLQDRIFDPFGMKTAIQPDMRYPIPHYAKSYFYKNRQTGQVAAGQPFRARTLDFSYNAGGGNLAMTVNDLINWGKQFVDGGKANRFARDMSLSSEIGDPFTPNMKQAYGWSLFQDRAGRWIFSTGGGSEAYIGSLSVWPEDELVVASFSNTWTLNSREGGFALELARNIGELLLDSGE